MLSQGVAFILLVVSIFGVVGFYGYNNIEELSKANWLIVASGLATLLGTVLSGITALYGFLNKKEIKKLKQELAVYDLNLEINSASKMRKELADYEFMCESAEDQFKIEYCEELFNTLKKFEKIEVISKMKKFKVLKVKARNRAIFTNLNNRYFETKLISIPKKTHLDYLLDILEKIEEYK